MASTAPRSNAAQAKSVIPKKIIKKEAAKETLKATPKETSKSAPATEGGGRSLERILEGAISVLSRRGATMLSMIDVGDAAGVSRATLYRYFSRKEDLLQAVGEYVSSTFIKGIKASAALHTDPYAKLSAVLQFTIDYSAAIKADRMLEVEPSFVLGFLQSHFSQHVAAFREVVEPAFDDFEEKLGIKLDRMLISELLMRAQGSVSLIPGGAVWATLPDVLPKSLRDIANPKKKKGKA
jgi:AcrR family transcriptional regulator